MNLGSKTKPKEGSKRRHANLLGLDFGTSGIKAVRIKKGKERPALAAVDQLPPLTDGAAERPPIPKPLSDYYVALAATVPGAILRVFNAPFPENAEIEDVVRDHLTVPADCRIGGIVIRPGRRECTMLGVAVPEKTVQHFLKLFSDGAPAPRSFELSGLAAMSAFLFNRGDETAERTVCLIEAGSRYTYAAFLNRNQLQIANRFEIGGDALSAQIRRALGVDEEMSRTILTADSSVDVSGPVCSAAGPFLKQLSIYREFVERQNKSTLSGVYLSGGLALSVHWRQALQDALGVKPEVWSPFEKLDVAPEVIPETLSGQEPRFAAAVGAALVGLEEI
jgi:Tfp pilus assembly PilM family ATPase